MMDCSEIRMLLSEYLDDALDEKAKARVDEHLRTCAACQKELDSLKALVKGIGSLESVKAPADFLDQLHKRMERRSKISEIWEWLFYPLRVKIPLTTGRGCGHGLSHIFHPTFAAGPTPFIFEVRA